MYARPWIRCWPITHAYVITSLALTIAEGYANYSEGLQLPWFDDDWSPPPSPCTRTNAVRDVVRSVVRQGGWDRVFVITDNLHCINDGYADLSDMAITSVTCDFRPILLAKAISSVPHSNGDYFNIVTDCGVKHIKRTIQHIPHQGAPYDMRFNWLFVNLPVKEYRQLTTFFKDGDSVVIVTSQLRATSVTSEIQLKWCLTDCYKDDTLREVGPISSPADILHFPVKFLPKRFEQFYGRELLVAYQEYKPYTYTVQDHGASHLTGIEVSLVTALAEQFNFTFRHVRPPDPAWGTRVNDTYWNGMIGMVMRGHADMASSSMSLSAERSKVIDYLHPYREEASVMGIMLSPNRWNFFVSVFDRTTLLVIAGLPPFTALTITFMVWVYDRIRGWRSWDLLGAVGFNNGYGTNLERSNVVQQFCVFTNYTFLCYGQLFLQGHSLPNDFAGPVRLVATGYWITVIILAAVYMGNLTASLAIRDVRLPFDTLHGLARDTEYILVLEKGTLKEQLFREAKSGIYRDLWRKVMQNPQESLVEDKFSKFAEVSRYTGNNKYVFTGSKLGFLENVRQMGVCDFQLLREEYLKGGTAFAVKQGVPYRKAFNKVLMSMQSSGLIDHWTNRHLTRDSCLTKRTQDEPVSLEDLTYVYLTVLGAGLGLACAALVLEWILRIPAAWSKYRLGSTADDTYR